jgi:hypothetical protein
VKPLRLISHIVYRLQRLLERYPDSVLANYVRLAKGRNLSRNFRDFTRDRIRPPQCDEALDHLNAVDVEVLPRYQQILHAISESRCEAFNGNSTVARDYRLRAEELGAGRQEFQRVLANR